MDTNKLWKDEKHSHFWIENENLFETYRTLLGLRYRFRLKVPGISDCDNCSNEMIKQIENQYYKTN